MDSTDQVVRHCGHSQYHNSVGAFCITVARLSLVVRALDMRLSGCMSSVPD